MSNALITKLDVTQQDIDGAKAGNAWNCPIARAASRIAGIDGAVFCDDNGDWKLVVFEQRYEVIGGGLYACQFDRGDMVAPRKFLLKHLDDEEDD